MKFFIKKILPLMLLAFFAMAIFSPLVALANGKEVVLEPPTKYKSLTELIEALTNFVFVLAIVAAPLVFLIGGFIFLTSGGDANKIKQGKDVMIYAAVGFGIVLLAKGLVELIKEVLGVEDSSAYFNNFLFLGTIKLKEIKRSILKDF